MTQTANENGRWMFIVNPIAGNGFAKKYESTVEEMIKKFGVDADVVYTEFSGHATELSELAALKRL